MGLGLGLGLWWPTKSSLIAGLIASLRARSTYFENENCTKATLQYLDDVNLLEKASIITTPTAYNDGSLNSVQGGEDADFDFQRGSAATRVNSQGLIENVQTLSGNLVQNGDFSEIGSELVANGGFDTDSGWTKGTGWSISGGKAICDGTIGFIFQSLVGTTTNEAFKITYTISNYISGSVAVGFGSGLNQPLGTQRNADGTYTEYLTKSSTSTSFGFKSASFIGSIDNVSVKEVGQDWTLGTGWSIGEDKATVDNTVNVSLDQTCLTSGKKYKVSFEISDLQVGGNITIGDIVTPSAYTATSNGTQTFYYTATNSTLRVRGKGYSCSITNISVIEITHDTDLPRIDYTDGCGSLLLEPQSTNLVLTSASGTYGNSPASEANTTSPDGTNNAVIPTPDSSSDRYEYSVSGGAYATNAKLAYSWYRKRISTPPNTSFLGDLEFKILVNVTQVGSTTQIQSDVNGFDRFQAIFNITDGSASSIVRAYFGSIVGVPGTVAYFGHQLEQSSYATSYIPTSGATTTRLADVCNNSGSSDLINSTEGVLYAEIATLANDGTRQISISSGSNNDRIAIAYNSSGRLDVNVRSGGVYQVIFNYTGVANPNIQNKIALKYKLNDFALWVNGVEVATDSSGITPVGLNVLNFSSANTSSQRFYGKTKAIAVFKEALSDDELEGLTTV